MNLGLQVYDATRISAKRKLLGRFLFLLRWRSCSSLFRQQLECSRIFHRNVGQNFAIEIYTRCFQPMDQLPVGDTVQSRSGPDALNPQPAILPFLYAAIAKCIAIGTIGSFLRGLVQLALGEEKTFCALEILLSPRTAFCAAFYACHLGFSLMKWETTGCAHAQKCAYGNGFVSGRTEPRVFTARRTLNAARYRPAGTREALPGAMPFRFSAKRRELALDFLLLLHQLR
jgi:hypothetical protein